MKTLVCILAAALLCACGKKPEEKADPPSKASLYHRVFKSERPGPEWIRVADHVQATRRPDSDRDILKLGYYHKEKTLLITVVFLESMQKTPFEASKGEIKDLPSYYTSLEVTPTAIGEGGAYAWHYYRRRPERESMKFFFSGYKSLTHDEGLIHVSTEGPFEDKELLEKAFLKVLKSVEPVKLSTTPEE